MFRVLDEAIYSDSFSLVRVFFGLPTFLIILMTFTSMQVYTFQRLSSSLDVRCTFFYSHFLYIIS